MAGVWGLKAIARELDTSPETVMRWYWTLDLPMLRRRRGAHPRPVWWAPKEALLAWVIAKARVDREQLRPRRKGRWSSRDGQRSGAREGNGGAR